MTNNKSKSVEELYKTYQEQRDNISSSVYSAIKAGMQETVHERNIHSILQQVKVERNSVSKSTLTEKTSLWSKISTWFTTKGSSSLWLSAPMKSSFAVIALAVISAPVIMNLQTNSSQQFSDYAHLSDCDECLGLVIASSGKTRSNNFQFNSNPESVFAARSGKLIANLKIINSQSPSVDLNTLKPVQKEMKLLAVKSNNEALESLSSNSAFDSASINETVKSMQAQLNSNELLAVFKSAEQLQTAHITALQAAKSGNAVKVDISFNRAVQALGNIPNLNPAASTALSDMRELAKNINWESPTEQNLSSVAKIAKQGLNALGL